MHRMFLRYNSVPNQLVLICPDTCFILRSPLKQPGFFTQGINVSHDSVQGTTSTDDEM